MYWQIRFFPIQQPTLPKIDIVVQLIVTCGELEAYIQLNFWTLYSEWNYDLGFPMEPLQRSSAVPHCQIAFHSDIMGKSRPGVVLRPGTLLSLCYKSDMVEINCRRYPVFQHSSLHYMHSWLYEPLMQFANPTYSLPGSLNLFSLFVDPQIKLHINTVLFQIWR